MHSFRFSDILAQIALGKPGKIENRGKGKSGGDTSFCALFACVVVVPSAVLLGSGVPSLCGCI